jgi:hypothetical protein
MSWADGLLLPVYAIAATIDSRFNRPGNQLEFTYD